jgi:glycosyltransferase involved in cell wall biosynthesis
MPARLLVISHELPGLNMSGPAIRYWHLAQALAAEFAVTLAAPGRVDLPAGRLRLVAYEPPAGDALRTAAADCDVALISGYLLRHYPFLSTLRQPLVVDLYDPFLLENLAIYAARPLAEQAATQRIDHAVVMDQLARGDYFLCASERQRDFWLGMLAAAGRLNPYTFAADPTLRRLIDVLPFGIPDAPPQPGRPAIKGVVPGIGPDDQVIYWGGGLWDWFDPLTAIRAVAALADRFPRARLFFAGIQHPNPAVPPMRQVAEAQRLSGELGLTGRRVFFNPWIPYADRADYLLEADIGLSLHLDQVEARLAFRTRLLDYLWAGLNMVVTSGDTLAELFVGRGLATAIAPGDVAAAADALAAGLSETAPARAERQARASALADEMRWPSVVRPLERFCRAPNLAADRGGHETASALRPGLAGKAWQSLRRQGPAGLWRDIRLYLNW